MEASLPDPSGRLGGSPYANPREVEHPLTPLGSLKVSKFAWIQPRLMHPAYEMWGGESVVATIRYRDLSKREALAASTEGVWNLTESPSRNEVLRAEAAGRAVAVFQREPMSDGALVIRAKRRFPWVRRSIWGMSYAFVDADGAEVMRFEAAGEGSDRTLLVIAPSALADPDVTLMAVVGKYLTLAVAPARERTKTT